MAESLDELIAAELVAHPDAENTVIAEAIFKRVSHAELITVLADYIANWRRSQVRKVEHQVPGWLAGGAEAARGYTNTTSFAQPFDPLADRRELLTKGVAIPDRGWIRWGEMTVEDHKARIAMLVRIREGIDRTVQLHVEAIEAIEAIEAAGVECLNDLYAQEESA